MNSTYSFNDLLEGKITSDEEILDIKSIEIPKIQRDYAQGRINKDIVSQNEIETLNGFGFISAIFDNLKNNTTMLLDYVYGALSDGIFIPLDGQQRLTTLFLLYWYVGAKELDKDEYDTLKSKLQHFTYETRSTSRIFCAQICGSELNTDDIPSKVIKNEFWYNSSYDRDPTVQAMFRMMDAIYELINGLKEKGVTKIFDRLENLRFYILPLNKFGLSDELYVKMNARGRQLTTYENFKADFTKWMKDKENPYAAEMSEKVSYHRYKLTHQDCISLKLDNEWTSLMWSLVKDSTKKIDVPYIQLFHRFALNKYFINDPLDNQKKSKSSLYVTFAEKEDTYTDFKDFKNIFELNQNLYSSVNGNAIFDFEKFLDRYMANKDSVEKEIQPSWTNYEESEENDDSPIADKRKTEKYSIFIDSKKFTGRYRIVFFCIQKYLENFDYDSKRFKEWMRIVWNITQNTDVNDIAVMIGVIQLLDEIGKYANIIYEKFADDNYIIQSNSSKDAVKEERRKAKFIIKDNSWEKLFIEAEKHPYFQGSINFLIDDNMSQPVFEHRKEMAYNMFDATGFSERYKGKGHILLRAIISNYNSCKYFTSKKFFTDIDEKEHYLKKMLVSDEIVISSLKHYCDQKNETELMDMLDNEVSRKSQICQTGPDGTGFTDFQLKQLKYAHEALYINQSVQNWMQKSHAIRLQYYWHMQAFAIARPRSWYDWIIFDEYRIKIVKYLIRDKGFSTSYDIKINNTDYIIGQDIWLEGKVGKDNYKIELRIDGNLYFEKNGEKLKNLNYREYEEKGDNIILAIDEKLGI